jgi:hypothetical protein
VEGAANLERSCLLEVLALQIKFCANTLAQQRGTEQWSAVKVIG